jgi:hypothetical protein
MLAAALLAGASERFFPTLIKKLDDPELDQLSKRSQVNEVTKVRNAFSVTGQPRTQPADIAVDSTKS